MTGWVLTSQTANFFVCAKLKSAVGIANHSSLSKMAKLLTKSKSTDVRTAASNLSLITLIKAAARKVRSLIVKMALNSSGICDISRVLNVSTNTVLGNLRRCAAQTAEPIVATRAKRVELDEFWSFVGKKKNQHWTWLSITSSTRRIEAFVNGQRTDKNCRKLMKKYQNSRVEQFSSDD